MNDPRDTYEAIADQRFRATTVNAARLARNYRPELYAFFAFIDREPCLSVEAEYAILTTREG